MHFADESDDSPSMNKGPSTNSWRHAFDLAVADDIAMVLNRDRERSSIELTFGCFHDDAITNGEYRCA